MSTDQKALAIINKSAEFVKAVEKMEETGSAIYKQNMRTLKMELKVLIAGYRSAPVPKKDIKQPRYPFAKKINWLAQ